MLVSRFDGRSRRSVPAAELGAQAVAAARAHFDAVRAALDDRAAALAAGASVDAAREVTTARVLPRGAGWLSDLPPDLCPIAAASRSCSCTLAGAAGPAGGVAHAVLPVRGGWADRGRLRRALMRAAEIRVGARMAVGGAVLGGGGASPRPSGWIVGLFPAPGGTGPAPGDVWSAVFVAPINSSPASSGRAVWRLNARGGDRWRGGSLAAGRRAEAVWADGDDGDVHPAGTLLLACPLCGGRATRDVLTWADRRRGMFGANGRTS